MDSKPPEPAKTGLTEGSQPLRILLMVGVIGIVGLGAALVLFLPETQRTQVWDGVEWLLAWLESRPMLLWAAIVILPGLVFPVSPLLLGFSAVGMNSYGLAITTALAVVAVILNATWTYFVAAYFLRDFFGLLFEKKRHLVPEVSRENMVYLGVVIRITPGIPLVFQNYLLGFLRMPFGLYLLVTIPIQLVYTPAWVLSGGAIGTGQWPLLFAGIALMVILAGMTHFLRKKFK